MHRPSAVPLADAEVAAGIARAVAKGGPADRSPTLEQLLAAFGEVEPTDAARRRVRDALIVADLAVVPDVLEARPGERVLLRAVGTAGLSTARGRGFLGLLALGGVLAAAAVTAGITGQGGDSAQDSLPAATATVAPAPPAATAPADDAPAPQDAERARDEQGSRAVQPTPAGGDTTTPDDAQATTTTETPAKRRARPRATAPKRLTVRLTAPRPTFLCVEDERGRKLFAGTLSGARAFRGKDLRFNIGLASTQVRVNGRAVPLSGSPTGIRVRGRGAVTPLPLGSRPC